MYAVEKQQLGKEEFLYFGERDANPHVQQFGRSLPADAG